MRFSFISDSFKNKWGYGKLAIEMMMPMQFNQSILITCTILCLFYEYSSKQFHNILFYSNSGRPVMNIENEVSSNSVKIVQDGTDETERDKLVQFEKTPDKTPPYHPNYFTQVSAIS